MLGISELSFYSIRVLRKACDSTKEKQIEVMGGKTY